MSSSMSSSSPEVARGELNILSSDPIMPSSESTSTTNNNDGEHLGTGNEAAAQDDASSDVSLPEALYFGSDVFDVSSDIFDSDHGDHQSDDEASGHGLEPLGLPQMYLVTGDTANLSSRPEDFENWDDYLGMVWSGEAVMLVFDDSELGRHTMLVHTKILTDFSPAFAEALQSAPSEQSSGLLTLDHGDGRIFTVRAFRQLYTVLLAGGPFRRMSEAHSRNLSPGQLLEIRRAASHFKMLVPLTWIDSWIAETVSSLSKTWHRSYQAAAMHPLVIAPYVTTGTNAGPSNMYSVQVPYHHPKPPTPAVHPSRTPLDAQRDLLLDVGHAIQLLWDLEVDIEAEGHAQENIQHTDNIHRHKNTYTRPPVRASDLIFVLCYSCPRQLLDQHFAHLPSRVKEALCIILDGGAGASASAPPGFPHAAGAGASTPATE